jgi:YVTN family beta-propeller protein
VEIAAADDATAASGQATYIVHSQLILMNRRRCPVGVVAVAIALFWVSVTACDRVADTAPVGIPASDGADEAVAGTTDAGLDTGAAMAGTTDTGLDTGAADTLDTGPPAATAEGVEPSHATPELVEEFPSSVSGDDSYFVYISNEYDATISVIDTATDEVIRTIAIAGRPGEVRPRGMAVSPDGRLIYVSVSDFLPLLETPEDKITVIDVLSNAVVLEIAAGGNPERVAISPDGTQVWAALEAIAQGGGFDTRTGERLATFRTGVEPEGVAVSPDGRWVYITAETTHSVSVIDRENLTAAGHFVVGNRPREVIFSPDGTRAYVSAEIGGAISVVDVGQHAVVDIISLGLDARPVEMVLSPGGERLYVAGGGTSAVYVIDTDSKHVISTVRQRMGRRPWGITITPDGKKLYTANGLSDSVSVIDTECLCVVKNLSVGRGPHSAEVGVLPRRQ